MLCCGKTVCRACIEDSIEGGMEQKLMYCPRPDARIVGESFRCAFCRELPPEDTVDAVQKLIKRGNAEAMVVLGWQYLHGDRVVRDQKRAIDLYHMAAKAGSSKACAWLGDRYMKGDIVVRSDRDKAVRLYSKAARLGNPLALCNIGMQRMMEGKEDFVYYTLASVSGGFQQALNAAKADFVAKRITKEDYAHALRSFQSTHEELQGGSRKKFNRRLASNCTINDVNAILGNNMSSNEDIMNV
ncbi:hypothetical protein ACHAXR_003125, partial [Thalassiosira sp. AJA248-18]